MPTPQPHLLAITIQKQRAAIEAADTTGSWRRRVAKARQMTRIRNAEARCRRSARPYLESGDDLPF